MLNYFSDALEEVSSLLPAPRAARAGGLVDAGGLTPRTREGTRPNRTPCRGTRRSEDERVAILRRISLLGQGGCRVGRNGYIQMAIPRRTGAISHSAPPPRPLKGSRAPVPLTAARRCHHAASRRQRRRRRRRRRRWYHHSRSCTPVDTTTNRGAERLAGDDGGGDGGGCPVRVRVLHDPLEHSS